jgi:hypothetical protein
VNREALCFKGSIEVRVDLISVDEGKGRLCMNNALAVKELTEKSIKPRNTLIY